MPPIVSLAWSLSQGYLHTGSAPGTALTRDLSHAPEETCAVRSYTAGASATQQ